MSLFLLVMFARGPAAQAYDPLNPLDPLNLPPRCEFTNGRYPCVRDGKVIRSRFEDPMFKRFFNDGPPSLFDCPDGYTWGLIMEPTKKFGEPHGMRYGCRDAMGKPAPSPGEVRVVDPPRVDDDPPQAVPDVLSAPQPRADVVEITPGALSPQAPQDDAEAGTVPSVVTLVIGAIMLLATGYVLGARRRRAP